MGIINKLFTFVAGTSKTGEAAQVNADFDALYNLVNGNIDDANVRATANIQQSKKLSLVTDLAARVSKAGDTMTGPLALRLAFPSIRMIGTDATNRDWRVITSGFGSNAGKLFFDRNDGTEAAPVWVDVYALAIDGLPLAAIDLTTKAYVDAADFANGSGLHFGKTTKIDGISVAAPFGSFTQVAGLFTSIIVANNHRVRVTFSGNAANDSVTQQPTFVTILIDGVNAGGADGFTTIYSDNNRPINASFSFVTDALAAGTHTFIIGQRSDTGNSVIYGDTNNPAIISAEELSTIF